MTEASQTAFVAQRLVVRSLAGLFALAVLGGVALAVYLVSMADGPSLSLDRGDLSEFGSIRPVEYRGFKKRSLYVPAPDGTRLALDLFLPSDPVAPESRTQFPTILRLTPYSRAHILSELSIIDRVMLRLERGSWGPVLDASTMKKVRVLLSRGYAYVVADMRGTGASGGATIQLDPRHGPDGAAIVDWITEQHWSSGSVCMHGQSYSGWVQFAVAAEQPEGLACIAPSQIFFDSYTGSTRPGGILAERWLTEYSEYLEGFTNNDIDRGYATAPVLDEDGDGELIDEVPIDYDEYGPIYRDRSDRERHVYASATLAHADNLQPHDMTAQQYRFFDSDIRHDGVVHSYLETSPGWMLATEIVDSDIAVFNIGGWFDGFGRGAFKSHATLAQSRTSRLFVAPRFHVPHEVTPAYRSYLDYEGSYYDQLVAEQLRFFDVHLKGLDDGWSEEPPVRIYTAHQGWQETDQWPPESTQSRQFRFGREGRLAMHAGDSGRDRYRVDWTHRSDYGGNRTNRWIMMWAPDSIMDRTEADRATLVYETEALKAPLEVTGHPVVELWISSPNDDADVFVYLSDVEPDGRSVYVSEGRLRLGFATAREDDRQVGGLIDVLPELPWGGYRRADYDPAGLAVGEPLQARFDLFPVSWVFREGHRIRIAIGGVDAGNFRPHPSNCPNGEVASCRPVELVIHRGQATPSGIHLPVATAEDGDTHADIRRAVKPSGPHHGP